MRVVVSVDFILIEKIIMFFAYKQRRRRKSSSMRSTLLSVTTILVGCLCIIRQNQLNMHEMARESRHPLYRTKSHSTAVADSGDDALSRKIHALFPGSLHHDGYHHNTAALPPHPERKLEESTSSYSSSSTSSSSRTPAAAHADSTTSSDFDPLNNIRYIAFGSSDTWGQGLPDKEGAYPYRFEQPTWLTRNAATRTNDVFLEAACAQSIVGEEIYDVISIEFETFSKSHSMLAGRLRNRFPTATLLFVRLWKPPSITFTFPHNGTTLTLEAWRRHHHLTALSLHSSELALEILEEGPENWSVDLSVDSTLQSVLNEVNAHLFTLPAPDFKSFSFPSNLRAFLHMFQPEAPYHLSSKGHDFMARSIVEFIAQRPPPRFHQDITGTWGAGDVCHLWYHTGQYHGATLVGARRVDFSHNLHTGSHKHAIEFRFRGGSLTVLNPFNDPRMLYLTYMTASDEEGSRIYPKTRIRLNGTPSVVIDPYHEGRESEHLTRTTAVGKVSPGETLVQLDPLQASRLRFRLVGFSLLEEDATGADIDFGLEPEPAIEDSPLLRGW